MYSALVLLLAIVVGSSCEKPTNGFGFPILPTSEVSRLLSDSSYVKEQIDCVLGKAKCDNFGNQLKLAVPEVLGKNCRSCDPEQAKNAKKVTDFIKDYFPGEFQQILKRYRIKRN